LLRSAWCTGAPNALGQRAVRAQDARVTYPVGTRFAASTDMRRKGHRAIEPARWDDLVLAVLLLIIGAPRAIDALIHERPIEAEGALSIICVTLGLLILIRRNAWSRPQKPTPGER
jgi:hypothetical protein